MSGDIGEMAMTKQEPIEWFFRNIDEPLFSHAEVLELAADGPRLSHDTLQNWANRKYVQPTIEGGKRRYRPLEVAAVIMAHHVVAELRVDPAGANRAILYGLMILADKVGKKISFAEAKYQIAVYRSPVAGGPSLYDARKSALEIFDKGEAFMVVPIGRLLEDLARRQRKMVESRTAKNAVA
jgi:hypothetical protein